MSVDVSFVVPVFDSAAWLEDCLSSLVAQSGATFEIVCVDDGSTDGSNEIIESFAASDPRVGLIRQANAGLSVARNVGVAAASGRYIAFVDSDDRYLDDYLGRLVQRSDAGRLDLLLFDGEAFREPGVEDETWERFARYYQRSEGLSGIEDGAAKLARLRAIRQYRPSACLYLVRRTLLDELELKFEPGAMHEDELFTFTLLLGSERVDHVPYRIYGRRVRPGSIMSLRDKKRSMQGYFAAAVGMMRLVSSRSFRPDVEAQVSSIVMSTFSACAKHFAEIPRPAREGLLELVGGGVEARFMLSMLRTITSLENKPPTAPGGPGFP